jgi:hypothetical protein
MLADDLATFLRSGGVSLSSLRAKHLHEQRESAALRS